MRDSPVLAHKGEEPFTDSLAGGREVGCCKADFMSLDDP